MSKHNIKAYWPFSQVKISDFKVNADGTVTTVKIEPDLRYLAICSECHQKVNQIHSYHTRTVRDLPMVQSIVILHLTYRKVRCPRCGIRVEHHDFIAPYARMTHRLSQFVYDLCQLMTITDVAKLLQLSWDQVKNIDKSELKKRYATINTQGLTILSVDEISIKKHHHYLTIIANYQTGQVVGVMKERNYYSLANFLKKLPIKVRENIKAVAMDMWDPYIKAVQECCPNAVIVFDFFHVVAAFNRVIDKIRNQQFRDADQQQKKLMKNSRFLLLKNPQHLKATERPRLKQILTQNQTLANVYILKEYLKRLWQYKYPKCAQEFFLYWYQLALDSKCKELYKFAKMLLRYSYGIINHCKFQIHTSKIEGINNKIKVIKRKAYGYHDLEYFSLKIIQATCN